MSTVNLSSTVVTDPDSFVGFKYYVKAGDIVDAEDFAESYKLNRANSTLMMCLLLRMPLQNSRLVSG